VPEAVTEKEALAPAITDIEVGDVTMTGRKTTVSVAPALVAVPSLFVTTTE